jgi:hypothetical protein
MISSSFLSVGTEALIVSDVGRTVVCYLIGTLFFVVGLSWFWLKQTLAPRMADTVTAGASDFRWWLAILGVVFLYVEYPTFSGSVRDRPSPGPNSSQAIAPTDQAAPIASFPAIELSPEVLHHRLTNDELRIKAYSVSEQVDLFASICGRELYAVDTNKDYDSSAKALEKIRIDAEISSSFRSKLRASIVGLFNELGTRISKDNPLISQSTRYA